MLQKVNQHPAKIDTHTSHAQTQLQRAAVNEAPAPDEAPPIVYDVLRSPGQPLDDSTRTFMESRFGQDFSGVRIHTDSRAADSAHAVNANAYTVGQHIIFGTNQYSPLTTKGQRLLRHELVHTVQQGNSPLHLPLKIDSPNSQLEYEARDIVSKVTRPFSSVKPNLNTENKIQRQDVCVADPYVEMSGTYDEQNQMCVAPQPIPEVDPVDGEFWVLGSPKFPNEPLLPVYDDETNAIVGFRTRGSVRKVYDLEGNLVEISEPGLESPLIDPIDIVSGGLTGLGRAGARSAARAVTRGGASAITRGGLATAIRTLSQHAITTVKGVFRAIRFRGALNFTATTAARMASSSRRVPHHILKLAIRYGKRSADPQGVAGTFQYTIQMFRNGTAYTLEVVIREADQTVLHFLYK